jgi:cathepsin L
MEYAEKEGGLCKEDDYKYTGKDGSCKASSCGSKYNHNSGVSEVSKDNSGKLEDAVVKGCVSVDIEADQTAFQHYSSGVLSGTCGDRTDHCVLVVGYGTDSGKQYWKVKNSWGTSWGEAGYVKICKECNKNGDKGECGILTDPKYPEF